MLIRWTPYNEFANIFHSFDNLLRQSAGSTEGAEATSEGSTASLNWSAGGAFPAVETFRRGDSLVLKAELPGVDPGDIEMTVEDGRLILRGEKKEEREEKDSHLYLREVSYGRFERSFRLPRGVKAEQVTARYRNGVLEVTVPARSLEEASRKVPIQLAEETSSRDVPRSA